MDNLCKNASVEPGLYSGVAEDVFACWNICGADFTFFLDRAWESKAVRVGVDVVVLDWELLNSRSIVARVHMIEKDPRLVRYPILCQ